MLLQHHTCLHNNSVGSCYVHSHNKIWTRGRPLNCCDACAGGEQHQNKNVKFRKHQVPGSASSEYLRLDSADLLHSFSQNIRRRHPSGYEEPSQTEYSGRYSGTPREHNRVLYRKPGMPRKNHRLGIGAPSRGKTRAPPDVCKIPWVPEYPRRK